MRYGNNINGTIVTFTGLPTKWENIEGFNYADVTLQEEKGFYELVAPILTETEKYGNIYFDTPNNVYTYEVIPKTEEEIQAEKLQANDEAKANLVVVQTAQQLEISAQQLTDPQDQLNNQAIYPMWSGNGHPYGLDVKVQAFDDVSLYLYKCVQAHNSQSDWQPPTNPALWTKVALDGVIPVWVQPTGAQDAYQTGDKVHFPTLSDPIYESIIDANVWSPTSYPTGWQLV